MKWEEDLVKNAKSIIEELFISLSDENKELGLQYLTEAVSEAASTMRKEGQEELVLTALSMGKQLTSKAAIKLKRRYEDPIRTTFFNVISNNKHGSVDQLIPSIINSFVIKFPYLVSAVDEDGWTPLHLACYLGSAIAVNELCKFNHLLNALEHSSQ
jgi:ankyrin repeat protein